ncbi:MAG: PEP-CTERM sorting domain-containing protein [Verrucomicrobiota bacterium]
MITQWFNKKLKVLSLLAGTLITALSSSAQAQLVWDGTTDSDWNTTSNNWDAGGGPGIAPWVNSNDAQFGLTGAGTVTATEAIIAGTMTFTDGAYTFEASGGSLSFTTLDTTGAASVGFNSVLAGSGTITSVVDGNWNGDNSAFTGTINHSSGSISINNANSLGTGTLNMSGGDLLSVNQSILNNTVTVNLTGGRIGGAGPGDQLRFAGAVNFNTGSTITIGNTVNNRTVAFESGSTFGGNASSVTIGRSTTFLRSGTNLTYTGDFNIQRTGPGDSVLNLGDGLDLTTNSNNINFNGSNNDRQRILEVTDGGTVTLDTISQNETTAGLVKLETTNSSTLNVNGVISGNYIDITGDGSGTTNFNAVNTYTGNTNVNAGTLVLDGTGSVNDSAEINVATGATLTNNSSVALTTSIVADGIVNGTGTIVLAAGNTLTGSGSTSLVTTIESGGTLSPGNSPGIFTNSADLNLEENSVVEWELIDNTAAGRGNNFDGVDVTGGALSIEDNVDFNLTFDLGTSTVDFTDSFWDSDQSWLVFDNSNSPLITDTTDIFNLGTISLDSLGNDFSVTQGALAFSQSGNDIFLNYTAIPEPSTFALFGLGLGALYFLRRKK